MLQHRTDGAGPEKPRLSPQAGIFDHDAGVPRSLTLTVWMILKQLMR